MEFAPVLDLKWFQFVSPVICRESPSEDWPPFWSLWEMLWDLPNCANIRLSSVSCLVCSVSIWPAQSPSTGCPLSVLKGRKRKKNISLFKQSNVLECNIMYYVIQTAVLVGHFWLSCEVAQHLWLQPCVLRMHWAQVMYVLSNGKWYENKCPLLDPAFLTGIIFKLCCVKELWISDYSGDCCIITNYSMVKWNFAALR